MNGLIAFSKKELTEQLRSFKALILMAVLFLFGMMSPLTAKILPDIFTGMQVQGITIIIPTPTAFDAYAQFFKNVGQMGLLVLLLLYGGLLSQDVTKGTLIVLLAKGLSRSAVIAAKFITSLIVWTAGYALAAFTAWGYTIYLFGADVVPNLLPAFFSLWLFGAFLLALLLFASTAAPGNYGGLLVTGAIIIVMLILNTFPIVSKWNPATLAASSTALLNGSLSTGEMAVTAYLTAGLIVALVALAIVIFKKKQL
ncbi:LPXTG cell wall anchor domain-containing protein [Oscillospiraceae bacterium CM]|nr:LPXTG cell wall anchor domain-containing protein [Oscillospiraceae bacterium CM]